MHPSLTPLPANKGPANISIWKNLFIFFFWLREDLGSSTWMAINRGGRWNAEATHSAPHRRRRRSRGGVTRLAADRHTPPPNPPCGAERNHFREKEKGCPPFVSGLFSPGSPVKVAGAARLERSRRPCSRCSSVRSRGSREPTTLPSTPAAAATGRRLSRPREEEVVCWVGTTGLGCTQA